MPTHRERHLSEIEKDRIRDRLHQIRDQIAEAGAKVAGLLFVNFLMFLFGMLIFSGAGNPNEGLPAKIGAGVMAIVVNFMLLGNVMKLKHCRQERRVLEDRLAGGITVVTPAVPRSMELHDERQRLFLSAVDVRGESLQ